MYIIPPSAVCLSASVLFLAGCGFFFKDPEVKVREIALRSFSLEELALDVSIFVKNPNALDITMKTILFDLSYLAGNDWKHLTDGRVSGIKIKKGENMLTIPVTIRNTDLLQALMNMIINGSIHLKIRGTASPVLLFFAPDIPFVEEFAVPLPGRDVRH